MINKTYDIQVEGSLPGARLTVYIQNASQELKLNHRPLVLVCPGGGYEFNSDREAEVFALQFLAMGCHAAVLNYSCKPAVFPTALGELAYSVALIRRNAAEWHVEPDKIIVLGCSAGGHLAASLGVFWDEDITVQAAGLGQEDHEMVRPDGLILCYPVISSGEFAHRGSFQSLLQEREQELSQRMSLEKQVSSKVPPVFVWHTFEDDVVPVENALLFASALRRAGVSTELHMYPRGGHGLGLANRISEGRDGYGQQEECATWISLVRTWIEKGFM